MANLKSDILKDPRFAHLVNDPRFRQLPKYEKKVKIDKRFESMFNDSKFKIKYTVDKYGRKVNQTSSEDLKKYYDIESSTDEEAEEIERREEEKQIAKVDSDDDKVDLDDVDHHNDELSNDGIVLSADIKKKLVDSKLDYARGEGRLLSDSSSDEESTSDADDEVFIEHVWGELDQDAPRTDESTNRLAACNMDWDRIRASDIMVLCNSFLPPGGSILSVKIYPSEFGKQRIEEEEVHGPPELTKSNGNISKENDSNSDSEEDVIKEQDSDAEEGDEYHMEKLRQYQLNRLKYYYAVIECDSVATADKLYKECDGLEYESTATKLDLRFIPDDVKFDEDEPRDVCTELPDLSKYNPRLFTTTALQQAKVELTWDETNIERKEIGEKLLSGKMNEISMADLKKYIACSSEEEEEEEEEKSRNDEEEDNRDFKKSESENSENEREPNKKKKVKDSISKYKSLLEEINKKEEQKKRNKFEIECSWTINTVDNDEEKEKDLKNKKNLTPIEKILEKRREKNKKRKEERRKKLKSNKTTDSTDSSEDDIPDGIDLNDPYFAEEFANGDFEPVKTSKKKSVKGKQKSYDRNDSNDDNNDEDKQVKELELLLDDGENDGKKHFSLKKIQDAETETKSKRKRKKKLKKSKQEIEAMKKSEIEDNFKINLNDERFQAIYTSHLYNIDPSDPHYKKTKNMEQIIKEKLKRKYEQNSNDDKKNKKLKSNSVMDEENLESNDSEIELKKPEKKIENSILVKNIKRKITGKHCNF